MPGGAAGGSVLLVRPDGNEADAAALREQLLLPWIDPYLVVRPVSDPAGARELLEALVTPEANRVTWLIVTSPRAVPAWSQLVGNSELERAVFEATGVERFNVRAFVRPELRAATVGRASAASLPGRLAASAVIAAQPSAAGLLAALADEPPGRAIVPESTIARPVLVAGLRELGWDVVARSVYQTLPVEEPPVSATAVTAGRVVAVVLRSPSAARALARFATPDRQVRIVAAGETTAAAAREQHWNVLLADGLSAHAVAAAVAAGLRRGT